MATQDDPVQTKHVEVERKVDAIIEQQPLQTQYVAPGAKATNVIMQNQQAVIMEYMSEPYIPDEVARLRPLETMMITKRAIGFESEFDIAQNDIEYEMITCVRAIAGDDVALDQALAYLHHREGLRAKGGAERQAQVTQRTLEELKTFNANDNRGGLWSRVGSFVKGGQPADTGNPFTSK